MTVHFRTLCTGAIIALGLAVLQSSSNAQAPRSGPTGPLGPSVVPSTPRTEGSQPSTIPINVHIAISSLREPLVKTIVRDKPQAGGHLPCAGWKQGSTLLRKVPVLHNIGEIPEDIVEEVVEKDPVLHGFLDVLTGGAYEVHRFVHHTVMKPINEFTGADVEFAYGLDFNDLTLSLQGDRLVMTADLGFSLSGEVKSVGLVPVGIKQIDHGSATVSISGMPHWTDTGALDLQGVTAEVNYSVSGVLEAFQVLPEQILTKEILKSTLASLIEDAVSKQSYGQLASDLGGKLRDPRQLKNGLWFTANASEAQLSDWWGADGALHTVVTLLGTPVVSKNKPQSAPALQIRNRRPEEGPPSFCFNAGIQLDYPTVAHELVRALGVSSLPVEPRIERGNEANELVLILEIPKAATFRSKATLELVENGHTIAFSRKPFSTTATSGLAKAFAGGLERLPTQISVNVRDFAGVSKLMDSDEGFHFELKDLRAEGLSVGSDSVEMRLVSAEGSVRYSRLSDLDFAEKHSVTLKNGNTLIVGVAQPDGRWMAIRLSQSGDPIDSDFTRLVGGAGFTVKPEKTSSGNIVLTGIGCDFNKYTLTLDEAGVPVGSWTALTHIADAPLAEFKAVPLKDGNKLIVGSEAGSHRIVRLRVSRTWEPIDRGFIPVADGGGESIEISSDPTGNPTVSVRGGDNARWSITLTGDGEPVATWQRQE